MRTAVLLAWGDVRVATVPVPRLGPGEALVRIEACGVCGSDALRWYVERKAPVVLGHEPAGTVVDIGTDVETVRPGDRVFVHHHAPCGECAECRRGLWSNCAVWRESRLDPGGFAEYARVTAPNVARDTLVLPPDLDFDTATFIEPVGCCIRALSRRGAVQSGDAVAVIGLGGMGLVMVQLARVYGAALVLGSDFVSERRTLALSLGADHALDPRDADLAETVQERTGGRGADVVLVTPADADAIRAATMAAAPGGRVVCFTPLPPDHSLEIDQSAMYFREITLTQSYSCGPDETRAALKLLHDHRIRVDSLITHRAGLDGVAGALERAGAKGPGIKSIIYPHR
jgi:L-iditol 2-dehydrogenase